MICLCETNTEKRNFINYIFRDNYYKRRSDRACKLDELFAAVSRYDCTTRRRRHGHVQFQGPTRIGILNVDLVYIRHNDVIFACRSNNNIVKRKVGKPIFFVRYTFSKIVLFNFLIGKFPNRA